MNQLLSNANLAIYVDIRLLRQLATDTTINSVNLTEDSITYAILRSGEEIASACTRSNIYTTTDLEDLATARNAMLEGLVADLALCYLFERRGGDVPEVVKAKANRSQESLSNLRDGKRVFANDTNRAAGLPSVSVIQLQTRGSLGMAADSSFFPVRNSTVS